MNYIWNRPLRSTLIDTLDSINHHEMGLVTDKGLEYALNDLKEAVVQDSKDDEKQCNDCPFYGHTRHRNWVV